MNLNIYKNIIILKMTLFYALIARNYDLIISEYTEYSGNFQQITRMLLHKLKISPTKTNENNDLITSIQYDKFIYNYIIEENILYLCMSFIDSEINSNANYIIAFLDDLKKFFSAQYTKYEIDHFKSYEVDFSGTIQSLMNFYNNKPKLTKSGLLIENYNEEETRIVNINNYFNNDEIIPITVVENDSYNSITVFKKNIVLSDYINKKEKIENIKIFVKILGVIFGFIFIMYLILYKFGNTSTKSVN